MGNIYLAHNAPRTSSPSSLTDLSDVVSELALDYDSDAAPYLFEEYSASLHSGSYFPPFDGEYDTENDSFDLDWPADADSVGDDWEDLYLDSDGSGDVETHTRDRPTYAQMTKVEVT